ncbi:ABC transporter permease subunit [Sinorhizobium meliloti]|uniref:ABC transporter permease n=1 Tax=Rhizobium meliloti TaxID=382 RepID=UPI003F17D9CE
MTDLDAQSRRSLDNEWLLRALLLIYRPGVARLMVLAIGLAVWQLAGLVIDPLFFAPPSSVIADFGSMLTTRAASGSLLGALMVMLLEVVTAFAIAVVIGTFIGVGVGLNGFSRRHFFPIVLLLYAMPQITLLPLLVTVLGIGAWFSITLGVTHAVFPIIFASYAGVQNLDQPLLRCAQSMGASRIQKLRHIVLPHMVPAFFSGMRLGLVGTVFGVLLAELYASSAGIGYFTRMFTDNFQASYLFGLVLLIAGIAVCLNETLRLVETRFSHWRSE